jgi:GNAT superfamily N-acetyltransferase
MASDPKAAPVQIRPAHESDIPELARLIAAIGAYHEAIDDRVRVDWDEIRDAPNWLKLILNRDHHAVWVAEHLAAGSGDGKLVGYLWVRLHRQRNGYLPKVTGYIANAFLEEAWRGKGLMKPMLELAYDWFRDKEITVVTLGVLHRNWIGSSAWYKLGFEAWNEERRIVLKPRPR